MNQLIATIFACVRKATHAIASPAVVFAYAKQNRAAGAGVYYFDGEKDGCCGGGCQCDSEECGC